MPERKFNIFILLKFAHGLDYFTLLSLALTGPGLVPVLCSCVEHYQYTTPTVYTL